MTFTVLIFAYRKPGSSLANFKTHYEHHHVPLIKSLAGDQFPKAHVRRYIQRLENGLPSSTQADGGVNAKTPAVVLVGAPTDFDYDAFAELIFDDEVAFQSFFALVGQGEAAERIAEDEEKFLDRQRTRAVVVGDCIVTSRN